MSDSLPDISIAAVRQILFDQLGCDPEQIAPASRICEDLGADSLDQVEIIMALEEHYGIEIPDESAEQIRTVQDILDYLEERLA